MTYPSVTIYIASPSCPILTYWMNVIFREEQTNIKVKGRIIILLMKHEKNWLGVATSVDHQSIID